MPAAREGAYEVVRFKQWPSELSGFCYTVGELIQSRLCGSVCSQWVVVHTL